MRAFERGNICKKVQRYVLHKHQHGIHTIQYKRKRSVHTRLRRDQSARKKCHAHRFLETNTHNEIKHPSVAADMFGFVFSNIWPQCHTKSFIVGIYWSDVFIVFIFHDLLWLPRWIWQQSKVKTNCWVGVALCFHVLWMHFVPQYCFWTLSQVSQKQRSTSKIAKAQKNSKLKKLKHQPP